FFVFLNEHKHQRVRLLPRRGSGVDIAANTENNTCIINLLLYLLYFVIFLTKASLCSPLPRRGSSISKHTRTYEIIPNTWCDVCHTRRPPNVLLSLITSGELQRLCIC
ncbi:unnamed protein product, partial [Pylaiella littoralis]